jgi:hypothetical protein
MNKQQQQQLREFECCISDDRHFCEEPVKLKSNCNICKKCALEFDCNEIKCNSCDSFHDAREIKSSILNVNSKLIKEIPMIQLFEVLKERFGDEIRNMEGMDKFRIELFFIL